MLSLLSARLLQNTRFMLQFCTSVFQAIWQSLPLNYYDRWKGHIRLKAEILCCGILRGCVVIS